MTRPVRRQRISSPVSGLEKLESRALLSSVTPASSDVEVIDVQAPADLIITGEDVVEELIRIVSVEYQDGVSAPAGSDRVSARVISNEVANQTESIVNDRSLTDFIWIWGQFIDHDIDLSENANPAEPLPIEVLAGDVFFDPSGTGEETIGFNRSVYVDGSESTDGVRQQMNQITSLLDGSVIYGSTTERTDALREFEGGRLLTSAGDLLPFNTVGLENAGGTSDSLFLAGDIRVNENVALSAMQTIWVREHNRIAAEIHEANPDLNDEQIFQEARSLVTAELQAITYNEFLPALLGNEALSRYSGFDSTVDSSISNIFSTAAFRLGHSLLSPELQRIDADGNVIDDGNLALQAAFFTPDELIDNGIDSILRGASTQLAQELDTQIVDDVRNFLFGPPGAGGFDLASLNIQRGRDHGLPDYNQARMDLGLEPVRTFSEITSDPGIAAALASVYGSVDDIDVWVGGLAEDHVDGGSVGELFSTIIIEQFERLRTADADWYQRRFSGPELAEIESTTLADVIERNTDITALQANVFFDADNQPEDTTNVERRCDDRHQTPQRRRNDRIASPRLRMPRESLVKSIILPVADESASTELVSSELQNTEREGEQQSQTNHRRRQPRRGTIVESSDMAELDALFKRPMDLFSYGA